MGNDWTHSRLGHRRSNWKKYSDAGELYVAFVCARLWSLSLSHLVEENNLNLFNGCILPTITVSVELHI